MARRRAEFRAERLGYGGHEGVEPRSRVPAALPGQRLEHRSAQGERELQLHPFAAATAIAQVAGLQASQLRMGLRTDDDAAVRESGPDLLSQRFVEATEE